MYDQKNNQIIYDSSKKSCAFSINSKKIVHSHTIHSNIFVHSFMDQKAIMQELTERSYQKKNMQNDCLQVNLSRVLRDE